MPVEVDRAVKNPVSDCTLYLEDEFRLDGQPRRRLLSVPKCTPHGLTTAMGSALVGDATLAIRGFRILGRHPLSTPPSPAPDRNDCRVGGVKYDT